MQAHMHEIGLSARGKGLHEDIDIDTGPRGWGLGLVNRTCTSGSSEDCACELVGNADPHHDIVPRAAAGLDA